MLTEDIQPLLPWRALEAIHVGCDQSVLLAGALAGCQTEKENIRTRLQTLSFLTLPGGETAHVGSLITDHVKSSKQKRDELMLSSGNRNKLQAFSSSAGTEFTSWRTQGLVRTATWSH